MSAVVDHIPDKNFKTIRHYGIYSRGLKKKFKRLLGMVIIAQKKKSMISLSHGHLTAQNVGAE